MLVALLFLVVAVASGTLLTYLYDSGASLGLRISSGTVIGLSLLGLIGFVFASSAGLSRVGCWLSALTLALSSVLLTSSAIRSQVLRDLKSAGTNISRCIERPSRMSPLLITYLIATVLLACFFSRAVFERDGAIYTGALSNLGDLPLHTSISSGFLYGHNYPPEHPQFAGARLSYPFIADFLTAFLMRSGMNLSLAMFLISFLLCVALLRLLYHWALELTQDKAAAIFSILLLFFSGGFGFWLLLDDLRLNHGNVGAALMHLSHEYTTEAVFGLRWANVLADILLPQRSFQLGLPLAIIAWTLWWQATGPGQLAKEASQGHRRMIAAGCVVGLLPLIHTATFIVMMTMAGCLALVLRRWSEWLVFFIAALLIAVPQLWWFSQGTSIQAHNVFAWQFGWDKGKDNAWWFWLKNTGLFIPLLLLATIPRGSRPIVPRRLLLFYLPFVLCFVIPNIARLVPWIWDNIKALIFWYIASVPLVALLLARLWRAKWVGGKVVTVGLTLLLTAAGMLDVWRIVSRSSEWAVFDRDAVRCAEMIREYCAPRALVLHAPVNNAAAYLTGRRSLLSVTFMAWAHGLGVDSREHDIARIYAGKPDAVALIERYGVDYAMVGPAERQRLDVNNAFFTRYTKVAETDGCQLYKVAAH